MLGDNKESKNKKNLFINKRIIPIWLVVLLLIIVIIAAFNGWKIVYAPEIENSWTAIDAIGGWISAIISGLAIWFAVKVPERIAEKQNDIALFEKRFNCYSCFQKYITISEYMNDDSYKNDRNRLKRLLLSNFKPGNVLNNKNDLLLATKEDESILDTLSFLFIDCYDENIVTDLLNKMGSAIDAIFNKDAELTEEEKGKILAFCNYCKELEKNTESMKNQLKLII